MKANKQNVAAYMWFIFNTSTVGNSPSSPYNIKSSGKVIEMSWPNDARWRIYASLNQTIIG